MWHEHFMMDPKSFALDMANKSVIKSSGMPGVL